MEKTLDNPSCIDEKQKQFYSEVIQGLTAKPKYLSSKYFYDKTGDRLFQEIMHCPEYYLARCELEILSNQSEIIAHEMKQHADSFDVIGLGAGDDSKTVYLLTEFLKKKMLETYFPIDISSNVISLLHKNLPKQLPQLKMKGFNGEYMEMLQQINEQSSKPKAILFLGSNIGNFQPEGAIHFCRQLRQLLQPEDLLFIGFDLKKHPRTILGAYNDKQGFTKSFNLNLLTRINRELDANFNLSAFDHYPTYDPRTGTCKSYLISLKDQLVHIGSQQTISFCKNESIQMEVSQKYDPEGIKILASESGYEVVNQFTDTRGWFVDCIWKRKN